MQESVCYIFEKDTIYDIPVWHDGHGHGGHGSSCGPFYNFWSSLNKSRAYEFRAPPSLFMIFSSQNKTEYPSKDAQETRL